MKQEFCHIVGHKKTTVDWHVVGHKKPIPDEKRPGIFFLFFEGRLKAGLFICIRRYKNNYFLKYYLFKNILK